MCFWLVSLLFRLLPNFQSPAFLGNLLVTHTFLMNFLISLKLLRAWGASIPWGMLHSLLYHSAVFICSACNSFTSAWSFYVRNPRDSLLVDEGSAGLNSYVTHGGLSDKETVNAGQKSCALINTVRLLPPSSHPDYAPVKRNITKKLFSICV